MINNLYPICILFFLNELINEFENNSIRKIYYVKNNKKRDINLTIFLNKIKEFDTFCELEEMLPAKFHRKYVVKNKIDKSLLIKLNSKSITCSSEKISQIYIVFDSAKEQSLLQYLNHKQHFIVNFKEADYIYSNRNIFKDEKLLNITDNLLSVFIEYDELTKTKSEKGKLKSTSTKFPEDSLFGFAQDVILKDSQVLICDDLGNEWADLISINENEIILCHAKYAISQLSASDFHVVVSQALKNLGKFVAIEDEWKKKIAKWENDKFRLNKVTTKISKILHNKSSLSIIRTINEVIEKPNYQRTIWLVINYISIKQLRMEFNKLKKSPSTYTKPQVVQMLWLLSSFVSVCKEFGVKVQIACKP
jgi:hypothetical protein